MGSLAKTFSGSMMIDLGILVGRAPWGAPSGSADPLVGLLGRTKSRTRGSGADQAVRPTSWLRLCCFVGGPFNGFAQSLGNSGVGKDDPAGIGQAHAAFDHGRRRQIGRASCRERG